MCKKYRAGKAIKTCIITTIFVDSNDPEYQRAKYCAETCRYRCEDGRPYKKAEVLE